MGEKMDMPDVKMGIPSGFFAQNGVEKSTSAASLFSMLEEVSLFTFSVDPDTKTFRFFKEGKGFAFSQGMNFSDYLLLVCPEDRSRTAQGYLEFMNGVLSGEQSKTDFVHSMIRQNAGPILLHVYLQHMTDADTPYILGCAVGHADVSEGRAIETLQQNIIDSTAAVVFVYDPDMREISFSENLHNILPGVPLKYGGDVIDSITQFVFPEDRKRMTEPLNDMLEGRASQYSSEFRILAGDRIVWVANRGKSYYDTVLRSTKIVGMLINLNDMNQYREITEESSRRHEITNLPGRRRLNTDIDKVIHDRNVFAAALILIDIREFHAFNDRFGKAMGDEILKGFSNRVSDYLPSGASLYHMSVDTFGVLWPHASRVQVERFMQFLTAENSKPLSAGSETVFVNCMMSASLFPSCGNAAEELLMNAEITLHKLKSDKNAKFAIFCASDKKEMTERLDFELQLTKSIRDTRENFILYYQPLISADGGRLAGAEALMRWISPEREIISPEKVIAGLIATGHMDNVGAWVLESGIRQMSEWLCSGVDPDFFLHINITAEDLMCADYSARVLSLLRKYSLPSRNLILEITESSLMKSISICRKNLVNLRKMGVRISLDDFGSGYSSLNYLRELPVDEVKIDRAFIEDVKKDCYNHSFISAIVLLAHSISTEVCIEGVESREQANTVATLNADTYQGFYYGRPVSAADFDKLYFQQSASVG